MFSFLRQAPKAPKSVTVEIDGRPVEVAVRLSKRAASFRLSLPASGPVLTLPERARWSDAEAFLLRHRNWLAARLPRAARAMRLEAGTEVPLRGVPHLVVGTGKLRGRVEILPLADLPELHVPGAPEHQPRRLFDWLKAEALADLGERSAFHAARLGVTVKDIKLRSQSSRWGSCSFEGALSYSWRLVIAPAFVLDYLAAHELAHRLELNHSKRYWKIVDGIFANRECAEAWLRTNGSSLHRYGAS